MSLPRQVKDLSVPIARCPEHGLHGAREECFECDGPVEQVRMVPAADFERLWRAAHGCQQRVRVQADNWLLLGLDDDRAAAARRVFRGLADELAEVLGYDVHVAPAGAEDPV